MSVEITFMVLLVALLFDAAFGYPDVVYRKIGHPVTWIGALIDYLDTRLNRSELNFADRKRNGIVALVFIIGMPFAAGLILQSLLSGTWIGTLALAAIASTFIASRSLHDHVHDVAKALNINGLDGARNAVARIVGRDPKALDEHGVARAAIESLAENASDGVVAPVFWFAMLGLPGLAAYKAINTADSMIGHRTDRHEAFGWAAARLDDIVNVPASRLTGLLFAMAAYLMTGISAKKTMTTMLRDAPKHRSPNAGWPEAAMAGAIDLKLNGPRSYDGKMIDDAYMGDGRCEATTADIHAALRLATTAWILMTAIIAALWLIART
jgi:adenosylcobinamide-phosphate synthase